MQRPQDRTTFFTTQQQKERLEAYQKRHGRPFAQILRLLLELPWDDDEITLIALKVPKTETYSRAGLKRFLAAAQADIEAFYFPPGTPEDPPPAETGFEVI